ncbi:MAG TPA: MBL fold metallo-hydrolase [Anaerolineae bacterium]|nr:MBL fold metallo-hydrolase [Anaerolineae bacterium]HID83772.1 lactamase [Anaerolineales bacterium]HIQ09607.1 lactamase [Anaerolineaceae bacterium]
MEITWYGHSCFRLTQRGLASVVTDPYNHTVVGYSPLKLKADVVTISHDAPGHNHLKAVHGVRYVVRGPGEYEIGGVFITGVRTNGRRRKEGEPLNTLYVIDFDGVTVAHLGDLRRVPTQAEVEALGPVHVLLLPVGGGGSLTPAKAAEVVNLLEPGIVIPMHYKTPNSPLDLAPLSRFLKEMGVADKEPLPSLKVRPSSIPDETQVVVLAYRR